MIVGSYPTRSDTELAQTALTAAGIPPWLTRTTPAALYPFDLSGGARLLVDEADAEKAVAILAPPES